MFHPANTDSGLRQAIQQAAHLIYHLEQAHLMRRTIAVAFLDIEKACDNVWRHGLLHKLATIHNPSWIMKLLGSWLQDRKRLSTTRTAEEGLPQASPVSPLLFNIYIADISTFRGDNKTKVFQFADDRRLENAMTTISKYTEEWRIQLNHKNTEAMLMDRNPPLRNSISFRKTRIPLQHTTLPYLGVTIDRRLLFRSHANKRMEMAFNRYNRLYRLLKDSSPLNIKNRRTLLNAILLPTALYGQEVWSRAPIPTIKKAEGKFHRLCRQTLQIPWYIKNKDYQTEPNITPLTGRINQ